MAPIGRKVIFLTDSNSYQYPIKKAYARTAQAFLLNALSVTHNGNKYPPVS